VLLLLVPPLLSPLLEPLLYLLPNNRLGSVAAVCGGDIVDKPVYGDIIDIDIDIDSRTSGGDMIHSRITHDTHLQDPSTLIYLRERER
jgi:hypothetical protein